jgi:ATP-dependent Clp protease protease subunit
MEEFKKFAKGNGVNENGLDKYIARMGYINPTILEERQLNVTQMDVFSRLMMERIIFLGTGIDADVANIVNAQMLYLSSLSGDEDITLNINSPGGEVYSGLAIIDTMNFINNDIQTVCMGMAASMGAVILSSGTKGKRSALKHSRVMIHQPLGGARGQASDILIEAEQIKLVKDELCKMLSDNSCQSFEKVIADCDRDHWLTASEALEYGLIDKIYTKKQ